MRMKTPPMQYFVWPCMNFLSGEKREEFPHHVQQVQDTAVKRHTVQVIIWRLIVKTLTLTINTLQKLQKS